MGQRLPDDPQTDRPDGSKTHFPSTSAHVSNRASTVSANVFDTPLTLCRTHRRFQRETALAIAAQSMHLHPDYAADFEEQDRYLSTLGNIENATIAA